MNMHFLDKPKRDLMEDFVDTICIVANDTEICPKILDVAKNPLMDMLAAVTYPDFACHSGLDCKKIGVGEEVSATCKVCRKTVTVPRTLLKDEFVPGMLKTLTDMACEEIPDDEKHKGVKSFCETGTNTVRNAII